MKKTMPTKVTYTVVAEPPFPPMPEHMHEAQVMHSYNYRMTKYFGDQPTGSEPRRYYELKNFGEIK